ncbi:unnamed protein product [Parnassius apollo]|uniref:(apollo) hypothetical protein n=1 Tax=Parnassius apollo TaxID=110799 RepID=A0A8S3Y9X2_PARAO|nr:unnamed protein product [Parnassius apollo]
MVRIHKQAREVDEDHLKNLKNETELLYGKMEGKLKMIFMIEKYPEMYNFIRPPSKEYEPPVPEYGRLQCVMEDFLGRVKYNQWYSLYVLTESVSCIHLVVEECLKVESMLFFTTNYGRNVGLPEFDAAQQHCTQMYALRYCIEQSMSMFVNLCETPCLCTYWCEDDYEWDSEDLINSPFRCLLELNVVEYRERLLKAYRKAIIPLKAYMRQYEGYRDIFMLSIEEYVE